MDYQGTPTTVVEMEGDQSIEWKLVVFADMCAECDCCGEPICHVCGDEHYAECDCPGPTQDDMFEYKEIDGAMYARELPEEPMRRHDDDTVW